MSAKPKILITGFDIFRSYDKNPSGESVQLLKERLESLEQRPEKLKNVDLHFISKIKVEYSCVDNLDYNSTCHLPSNNKFDVIINCGVSHKNTKKIHIETLAHFTGYSSKDFAGSLPSNSERICLSPQNVCDKSRLQPLSTKINVEKFCQLNSDNFNLSKDAGRYLCEYIFNKSLSLCPQSIFVHVSKEDQVSFQENVDLLIQILEFVVDDLNL